MKLLPFIWFFMIAGTLKAQDQYPSPEYANHPYFFDKSTKQITALEKSSAKISTKMKALGYGGTSIQYVIDGNTSSLSIPGGDTTEFVITGGNTMMDPSQMLSLYLLDANKKQRSAVMAQGKGLFGKKPEAGKITCLLKKFNDKYVLVVPQKLPPGQYAFINMVGGSGGGMDASYDAYCFMIK
jgi:hypothetical protein